MIEIESSDTDGTWVLSPVINATNSSSTNGNVNVNANTIKGHVSILVNDGIHVSMVYITKAAWLEIVKHEAVQEIAEILGITPDMVKDVEDKL